jgi:hypothetical protein
VQKASVKVVANCIIDESFLRLWLSLGLVAKDDIVVPASALVPGGLGHTMQQWIS